MFSFLSNLFKSKVPGRALRNEADSRVKEGKPVEAVELYRKALAEMDEAESVDPVEREQCLENLAVAHVVIGDYQMGDPQQNYGSAAECFALVLELKEKRLGPTDDDVAELVRTLMTLNYVSGRYAKALKYAERYLPVAEKLPIDFAADLIQTRTVLAQGNLALKKYPQAVEHYRELLETMIRVNGQVSTMNPDVPHHNQVLIVALSLAAALRQCGNHAEALSQYRQLLPVYEQASPMARQSMLFGGAEEPAYNWRLDRILGEIADCHGSLGQLDEAIKVNLERLESKKAAFGPADHNVLSALEDLGTMYRKASRLDDLVSVYEGLIAELEAKPAENSARLSGLLIKLGMLHCSQSRLDAAEFAFRRAMFIDQAAHALAAKSDDGQEAKRLCTSSVYYLSLVQFLRGDNEEAVSLARQAFDIPQPEQADPAEQAD